MKTKPLFKTIFSMGFLALVWSFKPSESHDYKRVIMHDAFQAKELLSYRIHYGVLNAGTVDMSVSKPLNIHNKKAYNFKIEGRTNKSFNWLYKVRDKFESWVDASSHTPLRYAKTVRENDYYHQDVAIYNHKENYLRNKEGKINITQNTQDLASAIYFMRQLDFKNKPLNYAYPMDIYIDNEIYNLKVAYKGKETIQTDLGKVRCIRLQPEMVVDRVFKEKDALTVWVSDDKNHIPVRIEAAIYVGSLKVDLTRYKNLKNPFQSLLKKK